MKVHKIEIVVIDFDNMGSEEVVSTIENQKYPNYCISPTVLNIISRDIGEWSDEHPLNNRFTYKEEISKLFV